MPRPSSSWTRLCSQSPRWRTLPSGQIEVEGLGVPLASLTDYHSDGLALVPVWNQWKHLIVPAAERFGLPAAWVVAIMVVESRGKNHQPNSAGYGGLMALSPTSVQVGLGRPASVADVMTPEVAVPAGAGFMADRARRFGWELPVIAASYNAGSPKCSTSTRCKSTIAGSWDFDGTSAENSMGMVEDCTQGRGSGYALRAVALNNSFVAQGLGGGLGRPLARVAVLGLGTASLLLLHRRYGADVRRSLGV